ncbi:MAG: PQ-loop domain-containing transporter [Nanoarchaeota archaeon]
MPNNQGGVLHHISKRKRNNLPKESNAVRLFDKFMIIIAIIHPLIAIPQIFHIYSLQNASGLSIISWIGYCLFNIPWLIYGFIHKEKPLIVAYILAMASNITVLIGIILYG